MLPKIPATPVNNEESGDDSHDSSDITSLVWKETDHSVHSASGVYKSGGGEMPNLKPQLPLPALSKTKIYQQIEMEFFEKQGGEDWKEETVQSKSNKKVLELLTCMEDRLYDVAVRVLDEHGEKEEEKERNGKKDMEKKWEETLEKLKMKKKRLRAQGRKAKNERMRKMLTREKLKTVRKENLLKKKLQRLREFLEKKRAMSQFKRDRWKYSKEVIDGKEKSGKPTFSAEDARAHFTKVNSDDKREHMFQPRRSMKRPPQPVHVFELQPPTLDEWKDILKKKRVRSAAGLNGIPYRLYKGCPRVFAQLTLIFGALWKRHKVVPLQWGIARTILLSKSEILDDPKEFRPISVTNAEGRLFWSAVERRMTKYFCENKIFRREEQKGFIPGVAGCMEQNELCLWALKLSKRFRQQICVVWIDLANAYGSVKHGLLQFMLNWYHVPKEIQELIFVYYENLRSKIFTEEFETDWFEVLIGVFQGCTLSTVLFNGVFQLLLDMIREEAPEEWRWKSPNDEAFSIAQLAYADDLSIYRHDPGKVQKALRVLDAGLDWTMTMKAKPKKCVSYAMGLFRFGRGESGPKTKTWTCPQRGDVEVTQDGCVDFDTYDPKLEIAGNICPYMAKEPDSKGFKMLGMWVENDLTNKKLISRTEDKLKNMLRRTDAAKVTGPCKVWIYNSLILAKLSWEFITYDFGETRLAEWEQLANQYLKKWLGLMKNAHNGVLYRPRSHVGLALKSLSEVAKLLGMTRRAILEASEDPHVLALRAYVKRKELQEVHWNPSKARAVVDGEAAFRRITRGAQTGRGGVGLRPGRDQDSWKKIFKDIQEEGRVAKAVQLVMAGAWVNWEGRQHFVADQLNLEAGIGRPGPRTLKFLLNAISETNCTAANHHRWFGSTRSCNLCGKELPGLQHILGGCQVALDQKRFTWRHDSVLSCMLKYLRDHLKAHNSTKATVNREDRYKKMFVQEGKARPPRRKLFHDFEEARDWKICADLGEDYDFTKYAVSAKRPDMLIASKSLKKLLMVELTVPCEENIATWHVEKIARYTPEMEEVQNAGWDVSIHAVEVGARGFVASSFSALLNAVNYPRPKRKEFLDNISRIALEASSVIYTLRHTLIWSAKELRE